MTVGAFAVSHLKNDLETKLGSRLKKILKNLTDEVFMFIIFTNDTPCRANIPMKAAKL